MRKLLITIMMALLMVGTAAAVTRTVNDASNTVTYSVTGTWTNLERGYWAVEDTFSGCIVDTVSSASCGTRCDYSIRSYGDDYVLRMTAYTAEVSPSSVITSAQVSLSGSGTCAISGVYAEAPGVTGTQLSMVGGSISLDGATCNNAADSNANCMIENSELLGFITNWVGNSVTNQQMLDTITIWVQGGY